MSPITSRLLRLVLLFVVLVPSAARASFTIDLIWSNAGAFPTLVVPTGLADSGTPCHDGFRGSTQLGACLEVRLTAAVPFRAAVVSLGWQETTGVQLGRLPPFSVGPFAFSGAGSTSPRVTGTADCAPLCDAAAGPFGVALSVGVIPAGTYTIGSVLFDPPFCCFSDPVISFLRSGVDGFIDKQGNFAPAQLNGAAIFHEPEPATAGLLGMGLVALAALAPRRRR